MKKLLFALAFVLLIGAGGLVLFHAEKPDASFGAVSGPEQYGSPFYGQNGVLVYPTYAKMNVASTTLCSIKSPAATTTLRSFVVNFKTSTSTAETIYMAKGATAQATTTNFETYSLASNAQGTFMASSTSRTLGLPIIAPNTYLNVGASASFGATWPLGNCTVELQGV